jgi:iron-sulfur cluster repair protein YtfE (RIC family)
MNADEFLAALNTVEQDHRLVLEKVQSLKDAVGWLLDPQGVDGEKVLDKFRVLNEYFATQFAAHMAEEETTLFPLLERRAPDGAALVARLREAHTEINQKREELESCLEVATDLEDGPPRMVLRDLVAYGWELWKALDDHAHAETRAVQECLDRSLRSQSA